MEDWSKGRCIGKRGGDWASRRNWGERLHGWAGEGEPLLDWRRRRLYERQRHATLPSTHPSTPALLPDACRLSAIPNFETLSKTAR